MSSSFVVTFNLKCLCKGDAVPIIYGNCKELGNGEPSQGIEFTSEPNSIYNYQARVRFSKEISTSSIWYSYCFRPSYGSMILENAPRRFLPQIQFNEIQTKNNSYHVSPSVSLYDTIDEVTPIGDLILHFRVRCFTQFGQHLYIVGSCDSLGNWDPCKAVQLFYEGNQDYWTGNVKIPLSNSPRVIEYKYFRSFIPKRKQKQTKIEIQNNNKKDNDDLNKNQENSRENTYKNIYKDFYRSKNRYGLFFNQNRNTNRNPITESQPTPQKPIEPEKVDEEYDLSVIEWEPSDIPNHKIEISPIISPTILEIIDTFRWSDPAQDSLTRSPFVNVINSRKTNDQNTRKVELNTENPGFVSVRFEALCPNIQRHQELYIVGSNKELGNWQFEKGLKMDDSNFPLFVATTSMKNEKKPETKESDRTDSLKSSKEKETEKAEILTAKPPEILYSFPFEYKFVIVCNKLKDVEVEVDDDSPLNEAELKKLEELKKVSKNNPNNNDQQLIKLMNRKKKVLQKRIEKVAIWESSPNRYCPGITSRNISDTFPLTLLINSWFVNPNDEMIKRYGVSSPLFSLRSSDSCGIGQYGDIRYLVDFCHRIGASMIQFPMPLFDTNTSVLSDVMKLFKSEEQQTSKSPLSILSSLDIQKLNSVICDDDENPLKIVSAFALHPIYISLFDIIPNMPKILFDDISQTKKELEKKSFVDYKVVYAYKMKILYHIYKEIVLVDKKKSDPSSPDFDYSTFYQSKVGSLLMDDRFDDFVKKESFWLYPYALFCFFREKYKNADFRKWPIEVSKAFYSTLENNDNSNWSEIINNLREKAELNNNNEDEINFDINFFLWIQYVCNAQFNKSLKYAVDKQIAFKGVFPMNVGFNSVDCWSFPFLFHRSKNQQENWCYQTVTVPEEPNIASKLLKPIVSLDDFSSCLVFPSFDWTFISNENESNKKCRNWWLKRISRCTELFHAIKIDPSLELCRAWEVDALKSVTSCLGHFSPCNPITKVDLDARNLTDIDRYTKPYVRRHLIEREFGSVKTEEIINHFFDLYDDSDNDKLKFKPEFDNERKLFESYKKSLCDNALKMVINGIENTRLFEYLIKLVDDVLLIEDDEEPGKYYLRSNFFNEPSITLTKSSSNNRLLPSASYSELSFNERNEMNNLYDYYTYIRQNELWLRISKQKQDIFRNNDNLPLICVDDNEICRTSSLSYEIRNQIGNQFRSSCILGLRVPRISHRRENGRFLSFDDPHTFDYLSVCSPSLHNTSSLRGWWEENNEKTNQFWHEQLLKDQSCIAPKSLNQDIHESIFKQCLWSGSELAIFLLQDLTGLVTYFRRQKPSEERITEPIESYSKSNNDSYDSCEDSYKIRYRVPLYLNELIKNNELTLKLKHLSIESHRIHYEEK